MKKSKKALGIGVITALSLSCIIPAAAFAKTETTQMTNGIAFSRTTADDDTVITNENGDPVWSFSFEIDPDSGEIRIQGDGVNETIKTADIDKFLDDLDVKGIVDSLDNRDVDYSKLTDAEQKELKEIYQKIDDILAKVIDDVTIDMSEEEFEKRCAPYEEEIEALQKRAEELEKKAGWSDFDSFIAFSNGTEGKTFSSIDSFLENIDVNELLKDLETEFASISDEDWKQLEELGKDLSEDLEDLLEDAIDG
jgi:DNA-binding PadR family transcriptional regulator